MKPGTQILTEMLQTPDASVDKLADIFWKGHPPFQPGAKDDCSHVTCRECWMAWLTTGEPPKRKEV